MTAAEHQAEMHCQANLSAARVAPWLADQPFEDHARALRLERDPGFYWVRRLTGEWTVAQYEGYLSGINAWSFVGLAGEYTNAELVDGEGPGLILVGRKLT